MIQTPEQAIARLQPQGKKKAKGAKAIELIDTIGVAEDDVYILGNADGGILGRQSLAYGRKVVKFPQPCKIGCKSMRQKSNGGSEWARRWKHRRPHKPKHPKSHGNQSP